MNKRDIKRYICMILVLVAVVFALVSCNKAENIQHNILRQSDSFETYREVTVINLRSDKVLMQVEGYISIKDSSQDELAIIIMDGPNRYRMHYVYFGGEVVYLVEQKENSTTDPYHWDIRIFAEFPRIVVD